MKLRQARKLASWHTRNVRYSEIQMREAQNRLINSGKREYSQAMGTVRRDQVLTESAYLYRCAITPPERFNGEQPRGY